MARTYRVLVVPAIGGKYHVTVIRDAWHRRERNPKELSKETVLNASDLVNAMTRATQTMIHDQSSSEGAEGASGAGHQDSSAPDAGQATA